MRVAVAIWGSRISPVFDVSRQLLLLDVDDGRVLARTLVTLEEDDALPRVAALAAWKVQTLLCGAISTPLAALLASHGIQVIPFLAGTAEEAVAAYLEGALSHPAWSMPGCGGRWGHFGRRRGRHRETDAPGSSGSETQPRVYSRGPGRHVRARGKQEGE
jgi:predicted Fe-Mo cluster-binding NifX family protein